MQHNLRDVQDRLLENLLNNDLSEKLIKSHGGISISDRLQVHRDTILENLVSSLRISYPMVWKLLGEDCARGVALAYSHDLSNLKPRGEMNDFGDRFPEFLGSFDSTRHIEYLSDFARFEWLRYMSYCSAREHVLPMKELQSFFVESGGEGCLNFNSSVYFISSQFPLLDIEKFLYNSEKNSLNLKSERSYIMIFRTDNKVEAIDLPYERWKILYALNQGKSLNQAVEYLSEDSFEAEMILIIKLLLSKNIVRGIND